MWFEYGKTVKFIKMNQCSIFKDILTRENALVNTLPFPEARKRRFQGFSLPEKPAFEPVLVAISSCAEIPASIDKAVTLVL